MLGGARDRVDAEGEQFTEWDDFSLAEATAGTRSRGACTSGSGRRRASAWTSSGGSGTDAGYRSDGEPGPRPEYGDDYYGAFLLDPDGNSVEAVHYDDVLRGRVDHLWIRVANVEASKRFYETIAPHARLRVGRDTPERVQFLRASGPGSFSVLTGDH